MNREMKIELSNSVNSIQFWVVLDKRGRYIFNNIFIDINKEIQIDLPFMAYRTINLNQLQFVSKLFYEMEGFPLPTNDYFWTECTILGLPQKFWKIYFG